MQAKHDDNRNPTLIGVSSVDFVTPVNIVINPLTGAVAIEESSFAIKITVDGSVTYIAKALPGTSQSSALWQAMKIDETTGTVITWADGNANFDNSVTDLTALTYS